MRIWPRDREEIRALIESNPGIRVGELSRRSRHYIDRVRRVVEDLDRAGTIEVIEHRNQRYCWLSDDLPSDPKHRIDPTAD